MKELPHYKCHKLVGALKIARLILHDTGHTTIDFEEEGYECLYVDKEFIDRHEPRVGGYIVMYEDGYRSYSPAKAFEDGYTRVADFKDRLKLELSDINEKLNKIQDFISTRKFKQLSDGCQSDILEQLQHMWNYRHVIRRRVRCLCDTNEMFDE